MIFVKVAVLKPSFIHSLFPLLVESYMQYVAATDQKFTDWRIEYLTIFPVYTGCEWVNKLAIWVAAQFVIFKFLLWQKKKNFLENFCSFQTLNLCVTKLLGGSKTILAKRKQLVF